MSTCTATVYIENATSLQEKLIRIDAIILALENLAIEYAAGKAGIASYSLNDGQTQISTTYKSMSDISNAIASYEQIRERILNKLNGRTFVLRPWRGLI